MPGLRGLVGRLSALAVASAALAFTSPAAADEEAPAPSAHPSAPAESPDAHAAEPPPAPAPAASASASASGSAEAPHAEHAPAAAGHAPAAGSPVDEPDDDGELSKAEELEGNALAKACLGEDGDECTKKYAEFLRRIIPHVREKALEKLEDKIDAKQAEKMATLSTALFALSSSGLLLFLMPLFLGKKYPGKGGVLFKFSAIAAVSTVVVMNLFALVVVLLKTVQGALGKYTNPQLQVVVAALDGIEEEAEHLVTMGPQLIQPTLDHVLTSDDPVPVALLENAHTLAKDAQPFITVGKWFKGVTWIFEYVPPLMTLIAVFLFLVGARPILKELVALPAKAAAGEDTRGIVSEAFKKVGREFLAVLALILGLIVATVVGGEMLALAVRPAVESFLDYFFANIIYVQYPNAASSHVFGSLGGVVIFLVLNVAVILASSGIYLGKFHKIWQAKLQRGVPLGQHRPFWIWGTLSLFGVQLFPYLFMLGAEPLVDVLTDKAFAKEQPNWSLALLSGPAIFVVGFLFLLWASRGLKGLVFVLKYKPEPPPAPAPAPAA